MERAFGVAFESEADHAAQARDDCRGAREARLDHLEIGAERKPGRQREVVEDLDALLVLDRQRRP